VVAPTIEPIAKAMVLGTKAGVDPTKLRDMLDGGPATLRSLEQHAEGKSKRRLEARFRIVLHKEDLAKALAMAREPAVSLPVNALAVELMNSTQAHDEA
jgi:2-hydroxy-3-oxopropionate reductase